VSEVDGLNGSLTCLGKGDDSRSAPRNVGHDVRANCEEGRGMSRGIVNPGFSLVVLGLKLRASSIMSPSECC
jgi:hypothetical protein